MTARSRRVALVVLTLSSAGCSTVQPLRPLEPGDFALEGSLVGVFLREDFVYAGAQPLIGARYGLTDTLELRGHLHPVGLFASVLSGDLGIVWHGPRVGEVRFHGALDAWWLSDPRANTGGLRGLINARSLVHWEASEVVWPFATLDAGLAFDDGDFVPGVGTGLQFPLGVWEVSIEARLSAFDERTNDFSQPYVGIGGQGILYGGIGLAYRL